MKFIQKERPCHIALGYMTRATHARVLSQTLTHGNSKNEIRQRTDEDGKKRGVSMERSKASRNKRIPDGTSCPKPKYNNNKQYIVIFNKK